MFEAFGPRLLLSADPVLSIRAAGVLGASLTAGDDQVVVQNVGLAADGGALLDLSLDGVWQRFGDRASGVRGIDIDGGAGDDSFGLIGVAVPVTLAGGAGDDTLIGPDGDGACLADLVRQDWATLDRYDNAAITQDGGASAHEVKTWVAANAAMNVASGGRYRAEGRYCRAIPQWIAGFAALTGTVPH